MTSRWQVETWPSFWDDVNNTRTINPSVYRADDHPHVVARFASEWGTLELLVDGDPSLRVAEFTQARLHGSIRFVVVGSLVRGTIYLIEFDVA